MVKYGQEVEVNLTPTLGESMRLTLNHSKVHLLHTKGVLATFYVANGARQGKPSKRYVICVLRRRSYNQTFTGVSRCSYLDEWDDDRGQIIAFNRAVQDYVDYIKD